MANFTARIVSQLNVTDGEVEHVEMDITATVAGKVKTFNLTPSAFQGMQWVGDQLGTDAIIEVGHKYEDHVRVAIQHISKPVPLRVIRAHLGWFVHNGVYGFAHAGGVIWPLEPAGAGVTGEDGRPEDGASQAEEDVPHGGDDGIEGTDFVAAGVETGNIEYDLRQIEKLLAKYQELLAAKKSAGNADNSSEGAHAGPRGPNCQAAGPARKPFVDRDFGPPGPKGPIDSTIDASNVGVRVLEQLSQFNLPPPPTSVEHYFAFAVSMLLLRLEPKHVMYPLVAYTYRAALGHPPYSMWLDAPTGNHKSVRAAMAQQHFGQEMDYQHLPAGWDATGNALAALAFDAKDVLLVMDDWLPNGPGGHQRQRGRQNRSFGPRQTTPAEAVARPTAHFVL